jgi:hypothetical protein
MGQAVILGIDARLTVTSIGPTRITVLLERSLVSIAIPLSLGQSYFFHVEGIGVRLHLRSIDRGEVLLGFEAPRKLPIDRSEVRK